MLFDWRIVIAFNPFSRAKISWHQKQSPNVVCRNGILRNSAKFTGKHLCQSFFFNKAAHLHMWKSFFFQKKLATTLHKFGYVEILLYDFSKGTALKLNQVSNSGHFTGALTYSRVHCSPVLRSLSFESFNLISVTRFAELIQF